MKNKTKSSNLLIGSMLFGLFFGAGNLIFPVHMGQEAGSNVLLATIGFLLTATGIPFLGILAMGITESKDTIQLGSRVSKFYGYVLTVLLYLTIGPFFALPRTATVSFQVGLAPILPENLQPIGLLIFTIVFFTVALFFSFYPSRIIDWVGKFLNPIFLLFLGFLFVKAFINPMGSFQSSESIGLYQSSPLAKGFIDGYQTMDAIASLVFAGIVIDSVKSFGTKEPKEIAKNTAKSGFVSVVLMCLIYGGLAWLGATSTSKLTISANGGIALAEISSYYLGSFGSIFLAITITVGCLKTAIGLITCCASIFHQMLPKVGSYKAFAIFFAVFSCAVANVGLTQIIALSLPMLMFLYPLAITLILLAIFENLFNKSQIVYRCVTIGAIIVSVGDGLNAMPDFISKSYFANSILNIYKNFIPFFNIGMGWIIPSIIGLVIGLVLKNLIEKKTA